MKLGQSVFSFLKQKIMAFSFCASSTRYLFYIAVISTAILFVLLSRFIWSSYTSVPIRHSAATLDLSTMDLENQKKRLTVIQRRNQDLQDQWSEYYKMVGDKTLKHFDLSIYSAVDFGLQVESLSNHTVDEFEALGKRFILAEYDVTLLSSYLEYMRFASFMLSLGYAPTYIALKDEGGVMRFNIKFVFLVLV